MDILTVKFGCGHSERHVLDVGEGDRKIESRDSCYNCLRKEQAEEEKIKERKRKGQLDPNLFSLFPMVGRARANREIANACQAIKALCEKWRHIGAFDTEARSAIYNYLKGLL